MTRAAVLSAILIGAATCLLGALPAVGASPSDIFSRQLTEAQQQRARAIAQSAEAERRAAAMALQAQRSTDAAERDRIALGALGLRIQAAEAQSAEIQSRIAILQALERQQRARLSAQQRPVANLMAALQLLTRRPPISLFAQPGATRDMVHTRAMIEAVLPQIRRRTAAVRQELARSRAIAAAQARAREALAASTQRLAQRRQDLARSEAQQRVRAADLASGAGLEGDRARALGAQAGDMRELLGQIEQSASRRDRLAALAGPVPRPGTVGAGGMPVATAARAAGPPPYRLPVIGDVVRGLGDVDATGTRARGVTIAAAGGAQVVAPAAGRIVYAGNFRSFGRIVIIDHGGGWTSLITNMIAVSGTVGETVAQGAPIGRAGPGRPRITVELRRAGQPVDIATLIS